MNDGDDDDLLVHNVDRTKGSVTGVYPHRLVVRQLNPLFNLCISFTYANFVIATRLL